MENRLVLTFSLQVTYVNSNGLNSTLRSKSNLPSGTNPFGVTLESIIFTSDKWTIPLKMSQTPSTITPNFHRRCRKNNTQLSSSTSMSPEIASCKIFVYDPYGHVSNTEIGDNDPSYDQDYHICNKLRISSS